MSEAARRSFLEDLEATRPIHVEKKLLIGGYVGWRGAVAREWLERKKAKKKNLQSWINVCAVLGTLIATGLTAYAAFVPK